MTLFDTFKSLNALTSRYFNLVCAISENPQGSQSPVSFIELQPSTILFFQCRNASVHIWKCRPALGAERMCCQSHKSLYRPSISSVFPWPCSACSPQAESINLTENPAENRKHDICKDILRATIATLQFGLLQATDCAAEVDCLNRFIYFKGSLLPTSASHSV